MDKKIITYAAIAVGAYIIYDYFKKYETKTESTDLSSTAVTMSQAEAGKIAKRIARLENSLAISRFSSRPTYIYDEISLLKKQLLAGGYTYISVDVRRRDGGKAVLTSKTIGKNLNFGVQVHCFKAPCN